MKAWMCCSKRSRASLLATRESFSISPRHPSFRSRCKTLTRRYGWSRKAKNPSPPRLNGASNLVSGGFGVPLERLRQFREGFDELVAKAPPAKPVHVSTQRPVYVTDSEADARAAVEEARWNMRVTLSLRNNRERVEKGRAIRGAL